MSYDIELNSDQKIDLMKRALEQIKDAPLLADERDRICADVLYLVEFGTYKAETSPYTQPMLQAALWGTNK